MKYDDDSFHQEEIVVCEGDSNQWSVGITRQTIEIILKSGKLAPPSDMLALWMFYAYTARWQNTNRPRATVAYIIKGLGWGRDKVRKARNGLAKLKLIEDAQQVDEGGKVTGAYVKINYLVRGRASEETTPLKTSRVVKFKTTPLKIHPVESQEAKCLGL